MENLFNYIQKINDNKILRKDITVYGWQYEYGYNLVEYAFPYYFKELNIIENIAKETNKNRDGRIRKKHYITIHDTGDVAPNHSAKFWSDTVYNEKLMDTNEPYAASFQYVVGNDGIYHNIPNDEIAYHAGDSTKFDYKLYKTNIKFSTKCDLKIINGEFFINDEASGIKCPKYIMDNGDKDCTLSDINEQGILIVNKEGYFYIGEIYFNETYKKIANRGGNNNSIGIEMCINENTDLYLSYLLLAKLVAKLLDENELSIDDIKQHHYFSGKNCPQTLRRNGLWNYFIELVKISIEFLKYEKKGYNISFNSMCTIIDDNGKILNYNNSKYIAYQITVSHQGNETKKTFLREL